MYELKKNKPEFEQISGPLAGRKFVHGKQYEDIPSEHKARFEQVKTKPAAKTAAKDGGDK